VARRRRTLAAGVTPGVSGESGSEDGSGVGLVVVEVVVVVVVVVLDVVHGVHEVEPESGAGTTISIPVEKWSQAVKLTKCQPDLWAGE
jgi:hypothetical protein